MAPCASSGDRREVTSPLLAPTTSCASSIEAGRRWTNSSVLGESLAWLLRKFASSTVSLLCWDKDGEVLAFANDANSAIGIWNFNSKQIEYVESSMGSKEKATFMQWSPTQPILAVGNNKGNLLLYNRETLRKVPLLGKHQKTIVCGAFSRDGEFLILGSDDHTLSISNMAGDTLNSLSGTGDLSDLDMVRTSSAGDVTNPEDAYTITVLINRKQMMMVHLANADAPINLQFHESYGKVITYEWLAEDRMMIGFEMGHLICVNTTMNGDNQVAEIFTAKDFKRGLYDMSISLGLDRVLAIGDNQFKAREIANMEDVSNLFEIGADDPTYTKVRASDDGNLMAIAGSAGSFLVYLTRMPVLGAAFGGTIVVLSSLQEITVYHGADLKPPVTFETKVEPSLITVGPLHVVVVLNNSAWFYEFARDAKEGVKLAYEYEYVSTVTALKVGQFFAVAKMDDRAQLHRIRNAQGRYVADSTSKMFPESSQQHSANAKLTDFGLTAQFFIYSTDAGHLQYFSLDEWVMVNEYRHARGIRAVFPEPNGVRLIFFDEKHDVYLYSPVDDHLSPLPNLYNTPLFKGCLWESFTVDKDTFIVFDETNIYVFLISGNQLSGGSLLPASPYRNPLGESVHHLGFTRLPYGYEPLLLNKGIVHCLTSSGRPTDLILETHKSDSKLDGKSPAALQSLLKQNLTLKRVRA
uniref:WD_REPEATS_REGION domain-containing protein n=1 Tax=Steinernema glaseri TaxID=37863 RepID=A0A1I7Y7I5_9BILA